MAGSVLAAIRLVASSGAYAGHVMGVVVLATLAGAIGVRLFRRRS